jgi:Fic family protein
MQVLLRSMNSYYSNKIEGQHTRPREIEYALKKNFSGDADVARRQRLAITHMEAEEQAEALITPGSSLHGQLYSAAAVCKLHELLFAALTTDERRLKDASVMVAGQLRTKEVKVGLHLAPTHGSVPAFLARWGDFYSHMRRGEASIVAACASHQRLSWIHPFADGNGRVARLHTHLLLTSMGLTNGLWSPMRGFARTHQRYYDFLAAADEPRAGELDGRGNLSELGLVRWIEYALDVCVDQVQFMSSMLDVAGMKDRIAACLVYEEKTLKSGVRQEALLPLHYLFAAQPEMSRADFKAMSTLGDRVATDTISALLRHGYLASDTAYGKLRFAIPQRALRFFFPALWPEAEQDQAEAATEERVRTAAPSVGRGPAVSKRGG